MDAGEEGAGRAAGTLGNLEAQRGIRLAARVAHGGLETRVGREECEVLALDRLAEELARAAVARAHQAVPVDQEHAVGLRDAGLAPPAGPVGLDHALGLGAAVALLQQAVLQREVVLQRLMRASRARRPPSSVRSPLTRNDWQPTSYPRCRSSGCARGR
jgi:hypothetical protein